MKLMWETLYRLITNRLSPRALAGPVGIVTITSQVAMFGGFWDLIRFTAFFSINLGIINLLPIPVLDGGHLLMALPEMLTGRSLPDKFVDVANRIGMALLLAFILFVTFIDLTRFELFETLFRVFGI